MSDKILILTPSDWSNTQRGNYFEDLIAKCFRKMRYMVRQRLRVTGMEIDILAEHEDTKVQALVECKFQKEAIDAPIINKLVGNAMSNEAISQAFLVSTSRLGKDAEGLHADYSRRDNRIRSNFDLRFAYVGPEKLIGLYLDSHSLPNIDKRILGLPEQLRRNTSSTTLVLTPFGDAWILEQKGNNLPDQAFAVSLDSTKDTITEFELFKKLLVDNKLWIGLPFEKVDVNTSVRVAKPPQREYITQVPVADKFDDYSPSRPEDFVGRAELLKGINKFLQQVRVNSNNKRIIAISGSTGFGKSSVIVKLAHKSQTTRGQNKFVFPVDSRSASSPLFVTEAIKRSFQAAVDNEFIDLPGLVISIDSVEDPLASTSIQDCLTNLEANKRVLVIFFDQFEELLTKDTLQSAFDAFRNLAFAVEAIQSNLVVGFSWRTGISLPESNSAYHLWHSLTDKRAEFTIGPFTKLESYQMLGTLERSLDVKLNRALKHHLLEQSQGLPWLLKKFCVHIYRQALYGVSQRSLIESQLDAATLFAEDQDGLSLSHKKCLLFIAKNAPVDVLDVEEKFDQSILNDLLHTKRLIIKTGSRYSIYWDIFKEYLLSNKVPPTPLTFFPTSQLATTLKVLKFIASKGSTTAEEISREFDYTYKTVSNIISDLSAFFLIRKRGDADFEATKDLGISDLEIAEYVGEQLQRHVVLREFRDLVKPGEMIKLGQMIKSVAKLYPSLKPRSLDTVNNRLLAWLSFAGLIDIQDEQLIRPISVSKSKGKLIARHSNRMGRSGSPGIFLCTSSPDRVLSLAIRLYTRHELTREHILENQDRNAAVDLLALGLAESNKKGLVCYGDLLKEGLSNEKIAELLRDHALSSTFLTNLKAKFDVITTINQRTVDEIAKIISLELGREWQLSSRRRYVNAGRTWLKHYRQINLAKGQSTLF